MWCKTDHFYVCRKCWETECKEGHGRGVKDVGKPSRAVAGMVILAVFFSLWYVPISYDYGLTNAWQSAPVSPVSTLVPDRLVKVVGTIVSSRFVAFGGHEVYYSKTGWEWLWNTSDTFQVSDSSGAILVSSEAWYIVYNGPHSSPYAVHTEMTMYAPGDTVQIVGTVARFGNGTLHLEAQIMSVASVVPLITLSPSFLDTALLLLLPTAILSTIGIGAALLLQRRWANRRAIGNLSVQAADLAVEFRDPNLDWQSHGRGTDPHRRAIWSVLVIGGGIGILALYPGFSPRPQSGYFGLAFIGTLVLSFAAMIPYMLLFGGVGHPSFVAVADDGFHMWFDSPYDRLLADTVFPWAEIGDIHMTQGKGAHWVLRWTTGEVTNLYMLTGKNLRLLRDAWAKRGSQTAGSDGRLGRAFAKSTQRTQTMSTLLTFIIGLTILGSLDLSANPPGLRSIAWVVIPAGFSLVVALYIGMRKLFPKTQS